MQKTNARAFVLLVQLQDQVLCLVKLGSMEAQSVTEQTDKQTIRKQRNRKS